ncbi:hypothetical protein [Microvirga lotononidis]|uniref:hypothetical protein n=1 Tax=Microvirga lotononidis TaxID=864069 RepID=UPI00058C8F4F|nr:hypothetical protein [Microvirga lotononidis]WQO31185.1 hypothetical protein U0023_33315 [Microvirga lotononidis]
MGFNGIEDQIQHDLLQLHAIAANGRQAVRQDGRDADGVLHRYGAGEFNHLANGAVDLQQIKPRRRLLDEVTDLVDDLPRVLLLTIWASNCRTLSRTGDRFDELKTGCETISADGFEFGGSAEGLSSYGNARKAKPKYRPHEPCDCRHRCRHSGNRAAVIDILLILKVSMELPLDFPKR